jgi:hypothetical protein
MPLLTGAMLRVTSRTCADEFCQEGGRRSDLGVRSEGGVRKVWRERCVEREIEIEREWILPVAKRVVGVRGDRWISGISGSRAGRRCRVCSASFSGLDLRLW